MKQAILPVSLGAALRHWWLHLWTGALLIALPLAIGKVVNWAFSSGGQLLPESGQLWLVCCSGAAVVGLLRLPLLWGVFWLARWQRWPLAVLLVVSAALFLAPMLLLLTGESVIQVVGLVSILMSLPFLLTYVVATYWLRRSIYASQTSSD